VLENFFVLHINIEHAQINTSYFAEKLKELESRFVQDLPFSLNLYDAIGGMQILP